MTTPSTTDKRTLNTALRDESEHVVRHRETPTKASWEAFLAQRKVQYAAQLAALRQK